MHHMPRVLQDLSNFDPFHQGLALPNQIFILVNRALTNVDTADADNSISLTERWRNA